MKELYTLKDVLEGQIKKIAAKGDAITPQEVDSAYKSVDIIKDIEEIEAMCRAKEMEENGQSMERGNSYGSYYKPRFNMYPPMPMGSYDDMSYERRMARDGGGSSDGRYSEDYSERRGRNANTGRYTSRDAYSGHDSKENIMREMEELKARLASM